MKKVLLLSIIILFSCFSGAVVSSADILKNSSFEDFEYKQKISVSFDTLCASASFQPVDIKVVFENPCWAKDETVHSIRVICDKNNELFELESQIYDLEFSNTNTLKSCSLVFLTPEDVDGSERFFVYYNPIETSGPEYTDHVEVVDSSYYYEPLPGQKIDFDYYDIRENDFSIYGIVQRGELIGNPIGLAAARMKPGSKVVDTSNIDQLGVFDLRYGITEEPGYIGGSSDQKPEKEILVDGNLMIRVKISCISPRNDVKTTNIYTYYYCLGDKKSVNVHSKNEVLMDVDISDPSIIDAAFAGIISIKSRSAKIDKMNVGDILPEIMVYDETENVKEYKIPDNPDSIEKEAVLSTKADIDLGSQAWVCSYDPDSGKTHAFIMGSNTGLDPGGDVDGIQVKQYVKQDIKLPGLEADTGNLYLMKNMYEKDTGHQTTLKQGFRNSYNIKFLSYEKGSAEKLEEESKIFQKMVKNVPLSGINTTTDAKDVETYNLNAFVHMAPSFPIGSILSAAIGKNFPYIYAELYQDNSLQSCGTVGRLALNQIDFSILSENLLTLVKSVPSFFDFRNTSFFKKIRFTDLEPGKYVLKVYRENRFFGKPSVFIGFATIDLNDDKTVRIYCRPEAEAEFVCFDQNDVALSDVSYELVFDDYVISEETSDTNGTVILKAPMNLGNSYKVRVLYKGFLVDETSFKLGLKNTVRSFYKEFYLERYNYKISVKDTWGFAPFVDINPMIFSNNMFEKNTISAETVDNGVYDFNGLFESEYTLNLNYKDVEYTKNIDIDSTKEENIVFLAEYNIDIDLVNRQGNCVSADKILIERNGKSEYYEFNKNTVTISVPPGLYQLTVYNEDNIISKLSLEIRGDKKQTMMTNNDSVVNNLLFYIGLLVVILGFFYLFWQKKTIPGLKIVVIGLLVISIVGPWWTLIGEEGGVNTESNAYLYPPVIVSFTETDSGVIGGEVSQVPEDVNMVLTLLSILIVVSIIMIVFSFFINHKYQKTNLILSILTVVILVLCISVFYYAMDMITSLGVGSFVGSGDLDISVAGVQNSSVVNCSWGPSIGFILTIISIILLVLSIAFKKKFE